VDLGRRSTIVCRCQTEQTRAFLLGPDKDGLLGHQRVRLNLDRAAHLARFDEVLNVVIDRLPAVATNAILHGIIVEEGALDALEACCNLLAARIATLAGALAAATLVLSHTRSVLGAAAESRRKNNHCLGGDRVRTGVDALRVPRPTHLGEGKGKTFASAVVCNRAKANFLLTVAKHTRAGRRLHPISLK
jgi:hypothetical protein